MTEIEKKNAAAAKVQKAEENGAKKKSAPKSDAKSAKKTGEKKSSAPAKKSAGKKSAGKAAGKKSEKRVSADRKRAERKAKRAELARSKREKRLALKAEREAIRAEKRVELARIKAERKAKASKDAAAKKAAKERKEQAIKAARIERKVKKQERRDMLKKETKAQREKRIAAERREKADLKRARRELAKERRRDRAERKKLIAEERRIKRREKAAKKKANKGWGGWLAAVISLGVVTLALGTFVAIDMFRMAPSDMAMSGMYQKSFYDLVQYVDNLDVNMSKLRVTDSRSEQIKLLSDVHAQALLAESDAQQLPLRDESKQSTMKFVNQLGDYAKTLTAKLAKGGALSEDDRENMDKLYRATRSLKEALSELSESMGDDYDFSKFGMNGKDDLVLSGFGELENNAVEYPTMIYDGPFSDGLENAEVKGLTGGEVDSAAAEEIFRETFGGYGVQSVSLLGEVNGKIAAYNFEGKLSEGRTIFAQISKTGGKLVMFDLYDVCTAENLTKEECVEIGENFLAAQGIKNMKAVWINVGDTTASINFAYEENGAICYSDLIKMTVCMEKGRVTGMEAMPYYLNHTERGVGKAKLSEAQARAKVSSLIEQETARLALIPLGNDRETLAYEIMGTYDGNAYYVYIDAATGEQVQLFRVVSTTEGDLLM